MGVAHHTIQELEAPFESVQELTTLIPRDREFVVQNGTFKIIIALRGDVSLQISPEYKFHLKERDIAILPEPCSQRYQTLGSDTENLQTLVILFDRTKIFGDPDSWGNTPAAKVAALCKSRFPEPTKIEGKKIKELLHLISQIREESENQLPGKYIRINSLICTLLVDLVRAAGSAPEAAQAIKGSRRLLVYQAQEFMLKNIGRSLTAGEIAWHLKMSQEHLSRIFKAETGYTLKPYLNMLRVNNAKMLLLHSNMTITEISEKCGFSTQSLFYRTFRQFFKMTPTQYRKRSEVSPTLRVMP